jgi:transposase
VVTAGNINDTTMLSDVLDAIVVPRNGRSGRPGDAPTECSRTSATARAPTATCCAARGSRTRSPSPRTRRPTGRDAEAKAAAPRAFDWEAYRHRNTVERCFNRLKQWRGLAMRSDKHAHNYEGGLLLASALLWGET